MTADLAIWLIAAGATAGVILRPWGLPEAVWALAGAALLVAAGLLPAAEALRGVARGTDVYLFLTGMMLLAEAARREGLFDWLAGRAARLAGGSAARLFTLIYLVGTGVTVFMSNDATAVVLTPAVAAVARAVRAAQPLPYLLICAFIANAASFVLPISNPANLVVYGNHMPPLAEWLPRYALPSLLAIAATYAVLRLSQRRALRQDLAGAIDTPALSAGGMLAAAGLAVTACLLLAASGFGWPLGPPACLGGVATVAAVLLRRRAAPWGLLRDVAWGVLPLVAGLFVLVQAVGRTGLLDHLATLLRHAEDASAPGAAWGVGLLLAAGCNVLNNLPAGLIAGTVVTAAHSAPSVTGAALIGIDLGPNLSVTGSLATILWLGVLRREGLRIGGGAFLRLGALAMPAALLPALAALAAFG